ncbi:MAG: helix-turn-helix transcriptional regulator [Hyphomicrobiaceae bacterium]
MAEINDAKLLEIDARVAKRLRLRREMLGLSQVNLAELCEISPQQIHKYENGTSKLSSVRLIQLANVLAVRVGWFFGEDDADGEEVNDFIELLSDRVHLDVLLTLSKVESRQRKELISRVVRVLSEGGLVDDDRPAVPLKSRAL